MLSVKSIFLHHSNSWIDRAVDWMATRDARWRYALAIYPVLVALPFFVLDERYESWTRVAYVLFCGLLAAGLLYVTTSQKMRAAQAWLELHAGTILNIVVIVYTLGMFYLAYWVRLRQGIGVSEDLALLEQPLWTTSHGRFLYTSFAGGNSYFSLHLAPIMILLSGVYALIPSIGSISVIQTILISATALPLYGLAKDTMGKVPALILAIAFLLHPTVVSQHLDLYLNHFVTFFWIGAALAFWRKHLLAFLVFSVFAAAVQEDIAFSLLIFALLAWLDHRPRKWKIVTLLFPLTWFIGGMLLMQLNSSVTGIALGGHFRDLGTTPAQVSQSALTHPDIILNKLLADSPAKVLWSYELLAPFLIFVPLASPMALAALPDWGIFSLLALPSEQYSVDWYFSLFIVTVLFTSVVYALNGIILRLRSDRLKITVPRAVSVLVLCSSLVMLPAVLNPSMFSGDNLDQVATAKKIQAMISPDDCLAATPDVLAFFAQRFQLVWFHYTGQRALGCKYIVVGQQYVDGLPDQSKLKQLLNDLKSENQYNLILSENEILLYRLK